MYSTFLRSGLLNDGFDSSPFPSARSGPDVGDMSYSDMRAKQQQLIEGILEAFFVYMMTIYQGLVLGFYFCH